jgi:hypothetical protein
MKGEAYPNPGAVTFRSWNGSLVTILYMDLVERNESVLVGSIVNKSGNKARGRLEVSYIYDRRRGRETTDPLAEPPPYTSTSTSAEIWFIRGLR